MSINFKNRKIVKTDSTETSVTVDPKFVFDALLDDKLDSTDTKLLSKNQNKLIKTLKDNNEKQR